MRYLVLCRDKQDSASNRESALKVHAEHIERVMDRILFAAPLATRDGLNGTDFSDFAASMFIVEAESIEAARELIKSDPYYQAGVWEEPEVFYAPVTAGTWVGGFPDRK